MEILIFVSGVLIGIIVQKIIQRKSVIGKLRIDRSEPDEAPLLFLELSSSVERVSHSNLVTLQVSNENFISQE